MKTVLITGGAGYIGTHICVELQSAGYEIVVVDNFSTSNKEALRRVQKITGKPFSSYFFDVSNREKLKALFSIHQFDAVIHLAGYKSVCESVSSPLKYYSNNMVSTIVLCEVMQEFHVKNLVFSSSATVYSPNNEEAILEDHPVGAINPYGRTKQMIEVILRDLYHSDPTWSIRVLRYFNPVGAHESGLIGEDPKGIPNNLVPYISNVAVGKLPTLFIYGNDYPTKDGTGIRDYIHVVDLALGHLRALNMIEISKGYDVFNLGTGRGYSVMEMIKAFEEASGKTIPYEYAPRRDGDVAVCFADVTKARTQLGWEATMGIEDMCKDAWRWQLNNPNGYERASSYKIIEISRNR